MGTATRCGVVIFSVELEAASDQRGTGPHRGLASLVRGLVQQLDGHLVPATWAVSDPGDGACLSPVTGSRVGHEIALLGDRSWIGAGVPRTTAAHELDRRILAAGKRSLVLRSLVLRDTLLGNQYNLLPTRGFTAVRGSRPEPGFRRSGIWFQSPDVTLPGGSLRWFSGGDVRRAKSAIRRALQCGGASHIAIRAHQLAGHQRSGLRALERILEQVQQWRRSDGLSVETLGGAARQRVHLIRPRPSRSILRPAA